MFMDDLGQWGQTIGCTGSTGNDCVAVVSLMVYPHNEQRCIVFSGCRHNDTFCTGTKVSFRFFTGKVVTCCFDDIIYSGFSPLQTFRFAAGSYENVASIDIQFTVFDLDRSVETPVYGVVFQCIYQIIQFARIVDCHDFNIVSGHCCAEYQTADTAKSIDTHFNFCHFFLLV